MKKWRALAIDFLYDCIGGILYATGIYTFATTADFAPGGISGLALILNYLFQVPMGITTLMMNIPLIILSYRFVGRRFLLKTMRSMVVSTIFLDFVFPLFPVYSGDHFLAALYSGVLIGAGMAFFYMRGSSSGGIDFLTVTIKVLRPQFSIGTVTMALDVVTILLGWPVFGKVDAVLYGMAATAISSMVMDRLLYSFGSGKLVLIVTTKGQKVADEIGKDGRRGSTMCQAVGTYTGKQRQLLICACARAEVYWIRHTAYQVDPACFVMVSEASEVFGEGFADPSGSSTFL